MTRGGSTGRAIDLEGGSDSIKVTGIYDGYETEDLYAWWNLDDTTSGIFWKEECRFEVGLDPQSYLYVKVYNLTCSGSTTYTTANLQWPGSGWHHLVVHRYEDGAGQQKFDLFVDFDQAGKETLETFTVPSIKPTAVYFGLGINGRVDEMQAANFAPSADARFDYDREYCGLDVAANTTCVEKVATASADDLGDAITWPLPVRYKVIYDQVACTDLTKCRVVFIISGGGSCADNYPAVGNGFTNRIVEYDPPSQERSHLAVVAVDPICWTPGFETYPDEITQTLAVKAAIAADPELDFLDLSGEYYASGCSHGARVMLKWAVENQAMPQNDHPKRTFVRSAGADTGAHMDCVYHTQWCGVVQENFDKFRFGSEGGECSPPVEIPYPHGHELPYPECADDYFEALTPFVDNIPSTVAALREVGRSWGRASEGETPCGNGDPSPIQCEEEGGLAATDSGRQFRDKWRLAENAQNRTGYFIEN